MKKKPKWLKIVVGVVLIIITAELILRFAVGLGDVPVYIENSKYEYQFAPNQDVYRFGNHFITNEYGMRGKPVNKKKKIKILEFGDSVLNGGTHIDQDNLVSELQESDLNNRFNNNVQILNVSAQSWGVGNAYAFLKEHGDFDCSVMVLVFSSHDYNDNMHFKKVVGVHPAWPSKKPLLAISDVWYRYVWPPVKRFFTNESEYEYLEDFNNYKFDKGWKRFMNYCAKKNIPLLIYLHATQSEIELKSFNKSGKKIMQFCKQNKLPFVTDLDLMNPNDCYIDDIHLNENGHKVMAEILNQRLHTILVKI